MTSELSNKQWREVSEKIRNLLNLRDNPGTPGEAAAAAAAVERLLLRWNLTEHELAPGEIPESIDKNDVLFYEADKWQRSMHETLLHVVAKNNFCRYIGGGGRGRRSGYLIGTPSNVKVVHEIVNYLRHELQRIAIVRCPIRGRGRAQWFNSFVAGAILEIRTRLEQARKEDVQANQSFALAIVNKNAIVDKRVREFFPRLRNAKSTMKTNPSGFNEGREAGRNVGFGRSSITAGNIALKG